jgi:AAA15 family ATPase/GTPase
MLRQISDIDNIRLAPCENSLTSIIQKYGIDFYNSREVIEKKQIASIEFERKRKQLQFFLIKNNIFIQTDFNMINTWDNSKILKQKIIDLYSDEPLTFIENFNN